MSLQANQELIDALQDAASTVGKITPKPIGTIVDGSNFVIDVHQKPDHSWQATVAFAGSAMVVAVTAYTFLKH